jgi:thiol-disulfide isomerase/thioredoxin
MHRLFSLPLAFFFAVVARAAAGEVELLNFTADSCPACRQMAPVLHDLAAAGAPIRRVDAQGERDLAARFHIEYLPTFVALVDGREVDRQVGATTPDRLREMLDRAGKGQETRDKRQGPEGAEHASSALESRHSTLDSLSSQPSTLDSQLIASSVRLRVEDPQGVSYGTGTIVAARPGEAIVLTCGHLFRESQGKQPVQVEVFEPSQASDNAHGSSGPLSVAISLEGEVLGYDLTRDLGLVRIRPTRPIHATPVAPRGESQTLQPGDKAASVGCDHGKTPSVWHTRLTAINRYVGPANVEAAGTPVQGRSGGGLFNTSGALIGVCFAADDQGNEGLYVGLEAIYEELDRLGLTSIVTASGPAGLAMNQPSPAGRQAAETIPADAPEPAPRGLVPVGSPDTAIASATSQTLTSEERAALEEIGQRSRGGEVIVIIRPKSPGDRCEILSLENPSQAFISELSAIGNKATVPRFTSQKELRANNTAPGQSSSRREPQGSQAQHLRGTTEWSAVPGGAR